MPVSNLLERGKWDLGSLSNQGPLVPPHGHEPIHNGFVETLHAPIIHFRRHTSTTFGDANARSAVARSPNPVRLGMARASGLKEWKLPDGVDPESLVAILARNLWTLMSASADLQSQLAVAKRAKIGQATVDRILGCTPGIKLSNVEALATAFGVNAWVLLHPNPAMASSEAAFYAKMRGVKVEK